MTWFALLTNALSLLAGFVLGLMVQWRRTERKGRLYLVPSFNFTAKRVDAILAVGVLVAIVGTVSYGIWSAEEDRKCIAVVRKALETRIYASEESRAATRELVTVVVVEGPVSPEVRRLAADTYDRRMESLDEYLLDHLILDAVPGCLD